VVVLRRDDPCQDAVQTLVAAGHSRAPVADNGDLDTVVGIVHLRDLVGDGGATGERAAPATFFPESIPVLDALRAMQHSRQQMAIVVNEHGGVEGIITVEDLLEELVGEIYDETDRDVLSVDHEPDGALVVPGRFPIHDLADLGVELRPGGYTTIAGLVLDALGAIPTEAGATITIDGWEATVLDVNDRAITKVRLRRHHPVIETDEA